jgi:thioesterase domain-containing protein
MSADATGQLLRFVSKWAETVVPLAQREQGAPFYLVHSVGGDVGSYSTLARLMSERFSVFGIQATKDVIDSGTAWTIPTLAAHYVDKLHHFQPAGPIILGGWSAGAVIALEMAQQLRTRGRTISCLVVFDGILKNTGGALHRWDPRYQLKLLFNLPRWIRDDLLRGRRNLRHLRRFTQRSRMPHSVDRFLDTSGWTQSAVLFSRTLFDALESYVPETYDGRILAYVAKTQPLTHLFQVAAVWTKICNRVEIARIPGTHLNLMKEPRVRDIAEHLSGRLPVLSGKNGYALEVA